MSLLDAVVRSTPIPAGLVTELVDSSPLLDDPFALRTRFAEDGYVFLRGALDREDVLAARAEVLGRLEAIGEIEADTDGIFTGQSRRDELHADRGEFWRSVSGGAAVRRVAHGPRAQQVIETILGEPATPFDYLMLRVGVQGRATEVHYDYPFFTRLHDRVVTVWTALGDVPIEQGPLFVVARSNQFQDKIADIEGFDVARQTNRTAAFEESAIEIAESRGTELLTTNYRAGDLVVFGMYTAHGSFDHHDESGRVRMSCDSRWQPTRLPIDARYMEPNIEGTTGAGYAELNGAKPLTEQWHVR